MSNSNLIKFVHSDDNLPSNLLESMHDNPPKCEKQRTCINLPDQKNQCPSLNSNQQSPLQKKQNRLEEYQFFTPQKSKNTNKFDKSNTQPTNANKSQSIVNFCNCRKSNCLKFYCICFSQGQMCNKNCCCDNCQNKSDNMFRSETINGIIQKNQYAFSKRSNIIEFPKNIDAGCNCRKSGCTKKYCQCFRKNQRCNKNCHCSQCENCQSKKIESNLLTQQQIIYQTFNILKKKIKLQKK